VPIDGCHRSFDELARVVLPAHMSRMREGMRSPIPMAEFAVKGVGPATLRNTLGFDHDPPGCYVLIDHGRPVPQPMYVGISKHVITRLMEHVRGTDHMSATLAYRIAANHDPRDERTATQRMQDANFRSRFREARDSLLSLNVAFVEIENPLELYLFEAYCALELNTGFETGGWNTFVTH
jgi:hypothetical protein